MINISKWISDDEEILFWLKKQIWLVPVILVFCPICIFFGLAILAHCFDNMFMGAISFKSNSTYLVSIVSLIAFIPLALLLPLSYIMNQLVITDKRIFIRKGLSGKLHIINFGDISAYRHFSIMTRVVKSHYIFLYLKSGKCIKSGELCIKKDSLSNLLFVLNSKSKDIYSIITTGREFREFKRKLNTACYIDTKSNYLFPTLSCAPFVLALIMVLLYISGINETWGHKDISVYGIIETKSISYNKYREISGYEFEVIDSESNLEYKVSVSEEEFNLFKEKDKVLIEAKKGALGIVYDQMFYKQ